MISTFQNRCQSWNLNTPVVFSNCRAYLVYILALAYKLNKGFSFDERFSQVLYIQFCPVSYRFSLKFPSNFRQRTFPSNISRLFFIQWQNEMASLTTDAKLMVNNKMIYKFVSSTFVISHTDPLQNGYQLKSHVREITLRCLLPHSFHNS